MRAYGSKWAIAFTTAIAVACTSGGGGGGGPGATPSDISGGDSTGGDAAAGDAKAGSDATSSGDTATGGGDTASPTSIPLDQYSGAVMDAMCAMMAKCGGGWQFSSLAACKAFFEFSLKGEGEGVFSAQARVKAGKATYDPVLAAKCIGEFTKGCGSLGKKTPAACAQALKGTAKDGATCTNDADCVSGSCKKSGASGCPGICAAPVDQGAECAKNSGCKGDLTCNGLKCGAPSGGKAGEACSVGSCGDGLWCQNAGSADSKCAAFGDTGAPCDDEQASCKAGLWCQQGANNERKCAAQSKLAEACPPGASAGTLFSSGVAGPCPVGAHCVLKPGSLAGAVCMTSAKLGEACSMEGECLGMDLTCAGAPSGKGVCKVVPAAGEACTQPNFMAGQLFSCLMPSFCNVTTNKCGPAPKVGEPCVLFCDGDLVCAKGKCAARAKVGQPCGDVPCANNLDCDNDICVAPVCK